MSAPVIDPALFRLRAFEADWLAPLAETSDSAFARLLVAEAERWILLGQRTGYFAPAPRAAATPPEQVSRFDRYFSPDTVLASDFSSILSDAQDDLTPARRTFLRLALFASDDEFDGALQDLSRVEAAAADPAALAGLVDSVEWALQGAESQIEVSSAHPAQWRSSGRALVRVGGLRAAQRLSKLERWRHRLAEAAGWKAAVDARRTHVEQGTDAEQGGRVVQAQVPIAQDASGSVVALTLGIETLGGLASPLIRRGESLPVSRAETFSTAADDQIAVDVNVVLGERPTAAANRSIGRLQLTGIPPGLRGRPQIEVTFSIDAQGILTVSARDLATSVEQTITIADATQLSADEVADALADAEAHEDQDRLTKNAIELRNKADTAIYETLHFLDDVGGRIPEPVRAALTAALGAVRTASSENGEGLEDALHSLQQARELALGQIQWHQAESGGVDPMGYAEAELAEAEAGGELVEEEEDGDR